MSEIVTMGEPKIICAIPFRHAEFIGKGYTIWRGTTNGNGLEGDEEQDMRSLVLKEVDLTEALFKIPINKGEDPITGEEKLKRLKSLGYILIDARFAAALYSEPCYSTLEWLRINRGINWFYFPGTTFRSPGGDRCVFFLHFYSFVHRWLSGMVRLESAWLFCGPAVVLVDNLSPAK